MKNSFLKRAGAAILSLAVLAGGAAAVSQITDSSITAYAATASEKESNDTISMANTVSTGVTYNAQLTEKDTDYFEITLPSSGALTVDFTAYFNRLGFYMYDSSGNEVWSWNNLCWNDVTKTIHSTAYAVLNKGKYYICFTKSSFYNTSLSLGNYNFNLSFDSSNESFTETGYGINNELSQANTVSFNKQYNGVLAINDKTDFYKITLPSTGTLSIDFSAYFNRLGFYIYDSNGNEVWNWSNLCWNDVTKSIDNTANALLNEGTYYFCFTKSPYYEQHICRGNYKFKLDFTSSGESFRETQEIFYNTLNEACAIKPGVKYNGAITINDNIDYYKFTLSSKTTVTLNTTHKAERLGLFVYNSEGVTVLNLGGLYRDDVTHVINNESVMELEKGTYYICFCKPTYYNIDTARGNFSFSISVPGATSVKLSKTSVTLDKGKTTTLTATVQPGTAYDKSVTWTSSDEKVASVSNGKITAKSGGTATITAKTSNGKTAKCTVKVIDPDVITGLKLNKTTISLGKGEQTTLIPTFNPSNARNKTLTWTTSNSKIVTVSNGKITGKANGTATITAKTNNGKTAKCTVTVKNAPSKVTLSKGILTLGVGEKYSLTSTIPDGSAAETRVYRTSNSSIVKMTRTYWQGEFVAQKPGVAYVTVRLYNGKESTCKVTVKKAPASVNLNKTSMTLKVGQSASLSAVIPSDAGCATRTFRTSNSSVVKMTKTNWTGQFKAMKKGTAYVTVRTYNGKEKSCKVTVV